jgi:hypothetical protein
VLLRVPSRVCRHRWCAYQEGLRLDSAGVVLRDAHVLALVLLLQVVGDQVARVLLDGPAENRGRCYNISFFLILFLAFIFLKYERDNAC